MGLLFLFSTHDSTYSLLFSAPYLSFSAYKPLRRLTVARTTGVNRGIAPVQRERLWLLCLLHRFSFFFLFFFFKRRLPAITCFLQSCDELDCRFSPFSYQDPGDFGSNFEGSRQLVCSGHTHSTVPPDNSSSPSSSKFIFQSFQSLAVLWDPTSTYRQQLK